MFKNTIALIATLLVVTLAVGCKPAATTEEVPAADAGAPTAPTADVGAEAPTADATAPAEAVVPVVTGTATPVTVTAVTTEPAAPAATEVPAGK